MAEPAGARGPIARSPIVPSDPVAVVGGWEVSARRSTAELTLTDLAPLTKVQVKAAPGDAVARLLGVGFGRSRRIDGTSGSSGSSGSSGAPVDLVVGSGPGEWLLLARPNTAAAVIDWCAAALDGGSPLVSVVDLTHGRALVRLTGERAADLLAKVCAIDFADEVTPDGAAFRSSVARLATDVVRDDLPAAVRSYLLHCERSSGQYLFDALLDAGTEFGIDVDGFVPVPVSRYRGPAARPLHDRSGADP